MMSLSVVCKSIDPDHVIPTTLPSAAEAEERRMRGGLYGINMIIRHSSPLPVSIPGPIASSSA